MAGRTLSLLDFTDFSFTNLDTGTSTIVWLAQNVGVAPYRTGRVLVSVRKADIADGGSVVSFGFEPVTLRWDDPSVFYRDGKVQFPATDLKLSGPLASDGGLLETSELTTADGPPLPSLLSLRMTVRQGMLGTALDFTIAVDLQLQEW